MSHNNMECSLLPIGIQVFESILLPFCTDSTLPNLSNYLFDSNSSPEFLDKCETELIGRIAKINIKDGMELSLPKEFTLQKYKERVLKISELLFDLQINGSYDAKDELHIRSVGHRFLKVLLRNQIFSSYRKNIRICMGNILFF